MLCDSKVSGSRGDRVKACVYLELGEEFPEERADRGPSTRSMQQVDMPSPMKQTSIRSACKTRNVAKCLREFDRLGAASATLGCRGRRLWLLDEPEGQDLPEAARHPRGALERFALLSQPLPGPDCCQEWGTAVNVQAACFSLQRASGFASSWERSGDGLWQHGQRLRHGSRLHAQPLQRCQGLSGVGVVSCQARLSE